MVRPLDPRLLTHARAARPYVVLTGATGLLTAGAAIGQAVVLARAVAGAAHGHPDLHEFTRLALVFAGLGAVRAGLAWVQERFGQRAATAVIGQLRSAVLTHVAATRPDRAQSAEVTTLVTRGLDALDGYLTRYLPQLLLVGTVTPLMLAVIWWNDTVAGLTVLITLPLIPLLMALTGLSTQANSARRLATLQRLGAQLLDLIAGLPTLRAFGRERAQAALVRQTGEAHRRATMTTLASAFLSSLVLETMATLSVALVAVGVGLRLVSGQLGLETGLLVLILAPEAFAPLRMLGVQYHASTDGLAACEQAFGVLATPVPDRGQVPAPDLRSARIRLSGVQVVQPGGRVAAPSGVDAVLQPGEVVALTGPSGSGKSTLLAVLLGLRTPDTGSVTLEAPFGPALDLASVDPESWWQQVAWVPQSPSLVPGTVLDNLALGHDRPGEAEIGRAAAQTGFDRVVAALPDGWATRIGQGGLGLSAGQRQRLAVTRALLRPAPLVLLDEPTAHLDAGAEATVLDGLRALRAAGRTVVVVAHRPALIALADRVVHVAAQPLSSPDRELAGVA